MRLNGEPRSEAKGGAEGLACEHAELNQIFPQMPVMTD